MKSCKSKCAVQCRPALLSALFMFVGLSSVFSQSRPEIIISKISDAIEGNNNGQYRVALNAPLPVNEDIQVSYTVSGTAIVGTDYNLYSPGFTATIPAGTVETVVEVDASNDGLIEGPEFTELQLTSAVGASGAYTIDPARNKATVTIVDANAASSTPLQVLTGINAMEPGSNGSFTVKLAGVATSAWPVSVAYVLSGTSTPGVDYQALGTLTIPANTNSIQVALAPFDDHIIEQVETFTFTILSGCTTDGGGNAFIFPPDPGNSNITMNIGDDDNIAPNQIVSILKTADAAEPSTNGSFEAKLPGDYVSSANITLSANVTGTATSGVDYSLSALTLPAYYNTVSLPVSVIDDIISEPPETVILTLNTSTDGNGASYTPDVTNGTASMMLTDDESPLPVKLVSFTGKRFSNDKIHLTWNTASENNTDYFNVQRSPDGAEFSTITRIEAHGSGNNSYSSEDNNPLAVNYYRLQMVDRDNKTDYSETIRIEDAVSNTATTIYPNPAKGQVTLKIGSDKLLNTQAVLSTASGQTKQIIHITDKTQDISLEHYAAGIYFLKFENGESIKLIVK